MRCFDILASLALLLMFLPLTILIAVLIKVTSRGPVIYWSDRVGKDNIIFHMPKFRTMQINTPAVATHLMTNSANYLTPIGSFLRKSSLDEIPQLWSILKGDMSFVGPRPALYNQDDLIKLRTDEGIHILQPGLTGWAQINGRDSLSIPEKVKWEKEYLQKKSFWFDMYIFFRTIHKIFFPKDVSH